MHYRDLMNDILAANEKLAAEAGTLYTKEYQDLYESTLLRYDAIELNRGELTEGYNLGMIVETIVSLYPKAPDEIKSILKAYAVGVTIKLEELTLEEW